MTTTTTTTPPPPPPSRIDLAVGRSFLPFCGSAFRSVEIEIAAALYVITCREHGDRWQPITPPMLQAALRAAVEHPERGELPWIGAVNFLGIGINMAGLIAGGWARFTTDAPFLAPIEALPSFHDVIAGWVRHEVTA